MATTKKRSTSSRASTKSSSRGGGRSSGSRSRSAGTSSRASSKTTTDHEQIRQWAEERGAKPSCVRGTGGGGDTGLLRLDFPGYSGEDKLQEISWDEFFEKFDEQGLALLYQEKTKGGERSNFNKLVSRSKSSASGRSRAGGGSARRSSGSGTRSKSTRRSKSA